MNGKIAHDVLPRNRMAPPTKPGAIHCEPREGKIVEHNCQHGLSSLPGNKIDGRGAWKKYERNLGTNSSNTEYLLRATIKKSREL